EIIVRDSNRFIKYLDTPKEFEDSENSEDLGLGEPGDKKKFAVCIIGGLAAKY
ncbi:18717_t:CDS:2, partial [Gigaspora margarita]